MVKDRFQEFQQKSKLLPKKISNNTKKESDEEDYFEQFTSLRGSLDDLEKKIEQLNRMRKDILASVKNDPLFRAQADQLEKNIMLQASDLNKKITAFKKNLEDDNFLANDPTRRRIYSSQINSILITYSNVVADLSSQQISFKESLKKQIKLKFDLANNRQYTEDELEKAIESNNFCHFTDNIVAETAEARQQLEEIETRHQKIIEIEKSINELKDMFVTFNAMITSQGQVIDNIAINVERAKESGIAANKNIKAALANQKSSRKKKLICAIIVLVILLIIILTSVLAKVLS